MNSGILFRYCVPFVFSAVVLRSAHNVPFHRTIYPYPYPPPMLTAATATANIASYLLNLGEERKTFKYANTREMPSHATVALTNADGITILETGSV